MNYYNFRKRILQMVHPVWPVKVVMGTAKSQMGKVDEERIYGEVTENLLLRLPFHDCIPYGDGSGMKVWNKTDIQVIIE